MSRILCFILILLPLTSTGVTYGQELIFNFAQDRETYTWTDSLTWEPRIFGRKPILFSNTSTSILIKEDILLDRKDRWQENYRSRLELRLLEKSNFSTSGTFANLYSSFEDRTVVENSIGLSMRFTPSPNFSAQNSGSFVTLARSNFGKKHRANGFQDVLSADFNYRFSSSSAVDVSYKQDMKILPEIPEIAFEGDASYFNLGTKDTLRFAVNGEIQNNKYFTSSQNYEDISRQRKLATGARLNASFVPVWNTRVQVTSNFDYRQYRYKHYGTRGSGAASGLLGSDNSSMNIDLKVNASRKLIDRVAFETHYMFRELQEDYGSLSSKQTIKTGEMRFALRSNFTASDSAWIETIFSVTGYFSDQPSSFFSDRDRLMQLLAGGFMHRFSPSFVMRVDGSYRDYHQTYVSGALSANNNHNTVYVIMPELSWKPMPWFHIRNSFLLHANYVWYDHEKDVSSERNTLFRRGQWKSEYSITVSRKLRIEPSYSYKYEDFGQLLWREQWVQMTNWDRKIHLPALELSYIPWRGVRFNPGMSYERKKSWEFVALESGAIERVEKELFERTTVHFDIDYTPSPRTKIMASIQRRVQKSNVYADDTTNQFVINLYRTF